jgi:hypothetical protein
MQLPPCQLLYGGILGSCYLARGQVHQYLVGLCRLRGQPGPPPEEAIWGCMVPVKNCSDPLWVKKTFKIVYKQFDCVAGVGSQRAHNGWIQHVFLHKKTIINISRLTIIKVGSYVPYLWYWRVLTLPVITFDPEGVRPYVLHKTC